jgi:riboflavin biosynthesis pyrimidine reductase
MEPIVTLYEREAAPASTLPASLAQLYGGGLLIPQHAGRDRPYVFANFVETIDGIVSYNAPGQKGGGVISGGNKQDQMVMGILRAEADAVIFGSGSLHEDSGHIRIPAFIFPALAEEYTALRALLGKRERLPMSVIMTASGRLNLREPTFHTTDLRVLVATTARGYDYLMQQQVPISTEVRIIENSQETVSPRETLRLLAREYGVRMALYEGGPTLLTSFLIEHVVDELFLTLAPQLAGRSESTPRLALLEGHAFQPQDAPWATLLSVKQAGSHLLLRYKL